MAEQPALLQQRLEFLQLELSASRDKELRLQQMYDTLLTSMSSPPPSEPDNSASNETQHRLEVERIAEEYRTQVREAKEQLKALQEIHRECEFSLRTQKLSYEETLLELRQQIYQLNNDKSHLNTKVKLLSSAAGYSPYSDDPAATIEALKSQIRSLSSELDKTRKLHDQSQTSISDQSHQVLQELKELYEADKAQLVLQMQKLQSELKYQKDVVTADLDKNYSLQLQERTDALYMQSQEELDEIRREKELFEAKSGHLEQELMSLREELKTSTSKNEQQKLFIRERMEKTKKLLEFASTTNEEMKKLKMQVGSLK